MCGKVAGSLASDKTKQSYVRSCHWITPSLMRAWGYDSHAKVYTCATQVVA